MRTKYLCLLLLALPGLLAAEERKNERLAAMGDNSWLYLEPQPSTRLVLEERRADSPMRRITSKEPYFREYTSPAFGGGKLIYFGGGHSGYLLFFRVHVFLSVCGVTDAALLRGACHGHMKKVAAIAALDVVSRGVQAGERIIPKHAFRFRTQDGDVFTLTIDAEREGRLGHRFHKRTRGRFTANLIVRQIAFAVSGWKAFGVMVKFSPNANGVPSTSRLLYRRPRWVGTIAADAQRSRQLIGFELLPMLSVDHPAAARLDILPRGDRGGAANHRHEIFTSPDLHPQNGKSVAKIS